MTIPILFALSATLHLFVGVRLVPHLSPAAGALLSALLLVSAIAAPLGLIARRAFRAPLADRLGRLGLPFLGLFSSLFIGTLLRELVLLAGWLFAAALPDRVDLAWLESITAAAVPALALAATLLGFVNAQRTPRIRTVEIAHAGLPAALDGFLIAQISDLHVGPTIRRRFVHRVVTAVNALAPDVVAITGDLVDGPVAELADEVAPLAALRAPDGVYFVSGNHEYYAGVHAWLAEVRRLGIRVLQNEHVVIEHGGARLVLAGVTDFNAGHFERSHRSDPDAALHGAPPDAGMKVLLAHQPRSAPAAARAGFDLQLSGHTHGGQFLPWNWFVRLQQPFTAGLHQLDRLRIYVSRGTGYWGPPKRFGAPSEITRIRLLRRPGSDEQRPPR
ncbi:MAG TPA: metallophosphoesterase [Ramlibacter sp.]|nr:metallophosphoesterase [Ramlibacter sp.]